MIDLNGFRPFNMASLMRLFPDAPRDPAALIEACQIKQRGYVDGRPSCAGALALARWLVAHADTLDAPRVSTHPLASGALMERILAGDVVPDEDFAQALAVMSEGAVSPDMFGLPAGSGRVSAKESAASAGTPQPDGVAAKAPERGDPPVCPVAVPSSDLPPIGALGGALPPGRLFHPIADTRLPQGFVLTGCGMMLCLDESTALAMRAAIDAGIAHLRDRRGAVAGRPQSVGGLAA